VSAEAAEHEVVALKETVAVDPGAMFRLLTIRHVTGDGVGEAWSNGQLLLPEANIAVAPLGTVTEPALIVNPFGAMISPDPMVWPVEFVGAFVIANKYWIVAPAPTVTPLEEPLTVML
jgi:hypothetical protein